MGILVHLQGSEYRSGERPYLHLDLRQPVIKVIQDRHLIRDAHGNIIWSYREPDMTEMRYSLPGTRAAILRS